MSALRFAFRQLIKTPGFTLVALVTLALGIGVNTSMYTLVDVLLFRNAPFPEPDRLAMIQGTTAQTQRDGFSFAETEEMRAQTTAPAGSAATSGPTHTLESLTTLSGWNNTLAEPGQPAERLYSIDASADFFATFRVQPILGRAYTAAEEVPGHNQVAILSYALWQSRFGGDPAILGPRAAPERRAGHRDRRDAGFVHLSALLGQDRPLAPHHHSAPYRRGPEQPLLLHGSAASIPASPASR
jgi:putative ABC transport system permease protein